MDVSGSFHQTVLETVKHFTGKRVTLAELHRWKNRSGDITTIGNCRPPGCNHWAANLNMTK